MIAFRHVRKIHIHVVMERSRRFLSTADGKQERRRSRRRRGQQRRRRNLSRQRHVAGHRLGRREERAARGEDALGLSRSARLAAAPADPRAVGIRRHQGAVPHALPRRPTRHRRLPHLQRGRGGDEAVRQDGNPAMDDRSQGRPATRLRLRVAAVRSCRSPGADAGLRHGHRARQRTNSPLAQIPGGRSPHAGDPGRRGGLVDLAR